MFPDVPVHEPPAAAADNHNEWISEEIIVSGILESRTDIDVVYQEADTEIANKDSRALEQVVGSGCQLGGTTNTGYPWF